MQGCKEAGASPSALSTQRRPCPDLLPGIHSLAKKEYYSYTFTEVVVHGLQENSQNTIHKKAFDLHDAHLKALIVIQSDGGTW